MSADKFLPADHPLPPHSPLVYITQDILSQAWGFPQRTTRNPSANPISLEKKYLAQLETHLTEYIVTEKSDGIRYLLVLGTHEGRGFGVLVNRKMQMFEVALCAHADYFRGSVFDGEMVLESCERASERQRFLVFDTVAVGGTSRRQEQVLPRYQEYRDAFDLEGKDLLQYDGHQWETLALEWAQQKKIVALGNKRALQFAPKHFVQLLHLGSLWRSLPQMKHKNDGLIFMRTTAPVGVGTDANIFKWKEHHTLDFLLKTRYTKGQWQTQLWFQDQERLVESSTHPFETQGKTRYCQLRPNPLFQATCQYYAELNQPHFSLLAECSIEFDPQQPLLWCTVLKWRRDKSTPNNNTVIHNTLNNIVENVTLQDLLDLAHRHTYQGHVTQ